PGHSRSFVTPSRQDALPTPEAGLAADGRRPPVETWKDCTETMELYPLLVLVVGIAIVMGLILALRVNAFIALIVAAFVVSLMAPGELSGKITRVINAFGSVAGAIGIVIALAAVIGKALMDSGGAQRIVNAMTGALGEKRTPLALLGSGYVLSVPV